jgi:hypothetical protein
MTYLLLSNQEIRLGRYHHQHLIQLYDLQYLGKTLGKMRKYTRYPIESPTAQWNLPYGRRTRIMITPSNVELHAVPMTKDKASTQPVSVTPNAKASTPKTAKQTNSKIK